MDHNKLWKILQEKGIPDHHTYLLKNMNAGQEATVWNRHGTTDWFKIGKGVWQSCILPSCLFKLYAEFIMQNARLSESQAGIKIAKRNINKLRYHTNVTKWRGTKWPLVEGERGEWKAVLKFSIEINKIMAASPITSWQIEGGKVEAVQIVFSWAPKSLWMLTAAMELKRHLLLGMKPIKN